MSLKTLLPAALLLAMTGACTHSGAGGGSGNSAQTITITEDMRAEIRRQGHDPDEEVCKRMEPTGSTIPTSVCATRVAWYAQTKAAREATGEIQRDALKVGDPRGG